MKRFKELLCFLGKIVIVAILGMILYYYLYNYLENCISKENEIKSQELQAKLAEEVNWQANYIWFKDEVDLKLEDLSNRWGCFRKTFNIENASDIRNIVANIAADSKYWLYVNGEIIVREGELKRGEKADSIYYDQIVLDDYLKKGENTIAILVWYFGNNSFSHIGANSVLLFQTQIGEQLIVSDDTWKSIQNPAYLKDEPIVNGRLSEENIYYDANLEEIDWYKNSYDDSNWNSAMVVGKVGDLPWGELIKRNIPFFEFSELEEYENFLEYRDRVFESGEKLELKLPYNLQFTPYLKVEAEAGKIITITLPSNEAEHRTTYVCKAGIQEFESLAWVNGEKVYYDIPAGIRVISLGYRKTGYKIENSGAFISDDEELNTLWKKAYRTLCVNMRDTYMDCPDRERAEWWADASIEMEEAVYSLDQNANALYRKAINTLIGWNYNGFLMTVNPSPKALVHLPIQMLLGIEQMYDYYLYTGEIDFLEQIYEPVKTYLNKWEIGETGLVSLKENYALWEWADSSGDCDYPADETVWYYYALTKFKDIALLLNRQEDLVDIEQRLNIIYTRFNENYWSERGYKTWEYDIYDVKVSAVAVLSGLASKDKYDVISNLLVEKRDNSPVMEKYVLEALCEMSKIEEAEQRMKEQYRGMIYLDCSTLWEYFDVNTGSKNHGWSGGPMIIMSKYLAGISPIIPGFSAIDIKPQFGNLRKIGAKVNTVAGTVIINANKDTEDNLKLEVNTPVRARVAIEKNVDNQEIYLDGKCIYKNNVANNNSKVEYEKEDEKYLYFWVEKGNYCFLSNIVSK